jgi:predicted nucleic acid-binding protein
MRTLLDTNVVSRLTPSPHAINQVAVGAVAALTQHGDEIVIVPQNLYEFWVVATRPLAQNGQGLSPSQVQAEVTRLKSLFTLLDDTPAIYPQWEHLVTQHQVLGKNAHDARLVAAMLVHGITRLLTFNPGDFQRFTGISVLTPHQVLAAAPPTP